MLCGGYYPSWEGAFRTLPGQYLVVTTLALALFVYARQRHRLWHVVVALIVGLLTGLAAGLGLFVGGQHASELGVISPAKQFELDIIAYFELWRSLVAALGGLLLGWLVLEVIGCVWSRSLDGSAREAGPLAEH